MRHVHPYLMSATGFQHKIDQAQALCLRQHPIVGHRPLTVRRHNAAHLLGLLPTDGRIHPALRLRWRSQQDGLIGLMKIVGHCRCGIAVFGNQHRAAGVAVQSVERTVHQVHTQPVAVDSKDVCQCVRRVSAGLVAGHIRRFVENQQVLILIHHRDLAIGADKMLHPMLAAVQKGNLQAIPRPKKVDGAGVFSV